MDIDVLTKSSQNISKRIDELKDCFEKIESQVAYQNIENEKNVFELR